jgi:tol-pal system protein YbgF
MNLTRITIVLVAALAGCTAVTTKHEGQVMRKDIDELKLRLDAKEKTLDDQIAELKRVLDESAKVLKRNSADLGADVDKLRDDIRNATGLVTTVQTEINELRKQAAKVDALETRLAALESKAPNPANPTSPEDIWSLGKTAFEAGRWDEARDLFKKLVTSFPTHVRAGEAQYFRAESLAKKGDIDTALGEFQKMLDKYPDHQLTDDALFRAGELAYGQKNCTEARAYYGTLRQKYPKSTLLKQSEAKEKEIKAAAKNKKKCSS